MEADMSNKPKTLAPRGNTSVMYIGADRYKSLSEAAIDVSYAGKRQITASQLAQYVLDNFTEQARLKLLIELSEASQG